MSFLLRQASNLSPLVWFRSFQYNWVNPTLKTTAVCPCLKLVTFIATVALVQFKPFETASEVGATIAINTGTGIRTGFGT